MANPFPALVAWLDTYCDTSTVLTNVRVEPGSSRVDWGSHVEVVRLFAEAEAFARTDPQWEMHEEVFRNAARLIFQPNVRWGEQSAQHMESFPEIRRVFGLMGRMWEYESGSGSTPPLTETALDTLRVSLQEVRAGLAVIPERFQEDRKHLERIIDVCLELLDADTVDADLVRSRVNETVGEAFAAVEKIPEAHRQGFFQQLATLSRTVNRYVSNAAAQALIGQGAIFFATKAIEAGS